MLNYSIRVKQYDAVLVASDDVRLYHQFVTALHDEDSLLLAALNQVANDPCLA